VRGASVVRVASMAPGGRAQGGTAHADMAHGNTAHTDMAHGNTAHTDMAHGNAARVDAVCYFDAASAAPLHPAARQALLASLDDGWADPSKLYAQARRARQLLDAATEAAAEMIGVRPAELTFCASGSEACRVAVQLTLLARAGAAGGGTGALVHSAVEHSAVLQAAQDHVAAGGRAIAVPVDRLGRAAAAGFAEVLRAGGVGAAALMSANHEVGTLQPVAEVAGECDAAGVPLIVDAAQSLGRIPVPDGWSVLVGSAHKWGGPPGVGLLAARGSASATRAASAGSASATRATPAARWSPPLPAAALPLVVAAVASLRAVTAEAQAQAARLAPLVDRIRSQVAASVPDVEVVGDPVHRLPHIVTFSCMYVDGEALLHALDRRGFAVSSGSSCTAQVLRPSHVLEAMGVLSQGNVRVSLHRDSTEAEVDRFLAQLPSIVADLRAEAGVLGL
jgi:cysteine desulfurase